ncbi:hypothetical protein L1987_60471 [Smallanthus sonchifolius]|uniref:Uncharacterized protein n=1 Tax=Smallanthus sonchifolius TaxID=185202 RepID=A0ACB9D8H8_9ASTR|nr:hypothetical protein L1987_60471 [Smallanthus sonchifolius]
MKGPIIYSQLHFVLLASYWQRLVMIQSSSHGDEYDGVIFSQLDLIDLAGSESSKTETTGLRRKEGSILYKQKSSNPWNFLAISNPEYYGPRKEKVEKASLEELEKKI